MLTCIRLQAEQGEQVRAPAAALQQQHAICGDPPESETCNNSQPCKHTS